MPESAVYLTDKRRTSLIQTLSDIEKEEHRLGTLHMAAMLPGDLTSAPSYKSRVSPDHPDIQRNYNRDSRDQMQENRNKRTYKETRAIPPSLRQGRKCLYGANQLSPAWFIFLSLFRFRGTVWTHLLRDPSYVILLLLHLFFALAWQNCWWGEACLEDSSGEPDPLWPQSDASVVTGSGTMLAFVLALYNNQNLERLKAVWALSMAGVGRIHDVTQLVKATMGQAPHLQWTVWRLVNLSHHLCYYSMLYTGHGENRWLHLRRDVRLILEEEEAYLMKYQRDKGHAWSLVCTWAMNTAAQAGREGHITSLQEQLLMDNLLQHRRALSSLSNYDDFPVPIEYQHMLDLLLTVYLVIVAFTSAQGQSPCIVSIGYVVTLTAYMGMRETAVAMAYPFGNDEIDLPWSDWVLGVTLESSACLADESGPCTAVDPSPDPSKVTAKPYGFSQLQMDRLSQKQGTSTRRLPI